MDLKPYAADPKKTKGRCFQEKKSPLRNDFQRDRDRVIHSVGFRRLMYKTQVFVNHEGDMYRTRLTHSLEVAQIARGICRSLGLNEDLAETIALAHDLGHTPFGHAGQDALNECMRPYGGFEHNLQSLRIVDVLEKRYLNFNGLNLTYESREGILKHCSKKNARILGELGERFLNCKQTSLEAQVVNFADEIAYTVHDLDDGFRSGILSFESLIKLPIIKEVFEVIQERDKFSKSQIMNECMRLLLYKLVSDFTFQSKATIQKENFLSIEDVRKHKNQAVGFSQQIKDCMKIIKQYTHKNLFQHKKVVEMTENAKSTVFKLFDYFEKNTNTLPQSYQKKENPYLGLCDYISGMTDRFAIDLASKL